MKTIIRAGLAVALTAATISTGVTSASAESTDVHVFLLKNDTKDPKAVADATVKKYGGKVRKVFTSPLPAFTTDMTEDQADDAYNNVPEISAQDDNASFKAAGSVSGHSDKPSWALDRIDQHDLPLDGKYKAPNDASNVHAYVFDTGIDAKNPEFGGRVSAGYDAIGGRGRGTDCNGHGTAMASLLGGSEHGVAKKAQIVDVRSLGCDGSATTEQIMDALQWVDQHAKKPAIAYLGFAGEVRSILGLEVYNLGVHGVSVTAPAGNGDEKGNGVDTCTNVVPGDVTNVIGVSATDNKDARAKWANIGSCSKIFAPGVDVPAASTKGGAHSYADSGSAHATASTRGADTVTGTSAAAALTAGAAALYVSDHTDADAHGVLDALTGAATQGKITDPGEKSPNKLLYVGGL